VTNPDLLLMDESTKGLTPLLMREVQRARAIADLKAQGLAILQVADYVHVLSRGCIVHSSVPEVLWHNQEVRARYLGM